MKSKKAYDTLKAQSPIIVKVLESLAPKYSSHDALARYVTNHDDRPKLVELIAGAAKHIITRPQ